MHVFTAYNVNELLFFCFPTALLAQVEYTVDVELNVTDVETVDYLRSLLTNGNFSLVLGPTVNVTQIEITTGKTGAPCDLNTMSGQCAQVCCAVSSLQLTK